MQIFYKHKIVKTCHDQREHKPILKVKKSNEKKKDCQIRSSRTFELEGESKLDMSISNFSMMVDIKKDKDDF